MEAARLTNVSRRYGKRWALIHLSVLIPEGHAVLLTGPNGAGKTTLLRILATALSPTKGALSIFGMSPATELDSIRRKIGLVTHKSHLYEEMTAIESLTLLSHFDRKVNAKDIPATLERVGLAARAHSTARTFSAGMRRRLSLARVLLQQPDLLLLDEPFTQLDPEGVALVIEVVRELKGRGVTLVMATHDVERGRAICDLHLHLVGGRLGAPISSLNATTVVKAE
ncbi:MAG: heme ABC exporter ATP-binding protein CcmA [Deltaproteobacteria bacterium]|nr:heme ABC exporter ATP-binding protein CcmA [Deltaproteobacteria bacterium]